MSSAPPPDLAPHSVEAEEAVLGSMLLNPGVIDEIAFLTADDFYAVRNGWIYEAMQALHEGGDPIDYLLVIQSLEIEGRLAEIGGAAYVLGLINKTPSALNASGYARVVQRLAVRRRLLDAASHIARLAHSEERDIEDVLDAANREMDAVTDAHAAGHSGGALTREVAADLLLEATIRQADPQDVIGMACGLGPLDRALGGWEPGLLSLVAARTGMGKSALLATLARGFAVQGHPVLVFALEMGQKAMLRRVICQEAQLNNKRVRHGRITEGELEQYRAAALRVGDMPLHIEALSGASVRTMRGIARRYVRELGVEIVMVDTMNRVRSDGRSQYERMTMTSHEMADWAHASEYAVIAAAQINRAPVQLKDKRPTLDTLRDSGATEEDADVVLGLHRESYYDRDALTPNVAEVWTLKVREGSDNARVDLFWQPAWPGFAELARPLTDLPDLARAKAKLADDDGLPDWMQGDR